jgi:GH3 auxin-responsive promoter
VKKKLLTNEGYKKYSDSGFIGDPTIRIVAPGTFKAYRQWKIEKSAFSPGQIKVPVTIVDAETRDWVVQRVVSEVEKVSFEIPYLSTILLTD